MKYILSTLTFLMGLNSFAALAPYFDQVKQFQAVLESDDLYSVLEGQKIISLKAVKYGEFKVSTKNCQVIVTLENHTPVHPGPTNYTVESISTPICK